MPSLQVFIFMKTQEPPVLTKGYEIEFLNEIINYNVNTI